MKKTLLKKIFGLIRSFLAILGLMFIIYSLCFELSVMTSDSMKPTLQGTWNTQQDYVLNEKVSYWFRSPGRWDIVKFQLHDDTGCAVMKRVVALEGETISLKDNWVYINGKPVDRPAYLDFLKYYPEGTLYGDQQVTCDGGYFALGDDSLDSYDSRFTGLVNQDDIESRAWLIVWPPSRMGLVR